MSPPPDLSIVIPTFNEEARLPESLERIHEFLGDEGLSAEVIVIDDGSRDATVSRALETANRIGRNVQTIRLDRNRGKGCAVRAGVLAATGRFILITDADLSTPIVEWRKLADANADVAIGSRALDERLLRRPQPFYRQAVGRFFNRIVRLLVLPEIHDTQCGFKLFERDAARRIFLEAVVDRFAFDVEALVIAKRLGYRIAEVPVLWSNSTDSRVSLRWGLHAFLDVVRIRLRAARHQDA